MPISLMLFMQETCRALDLAFERAGNNMAARIAIMAITTSNSMRVKPLTIIRSDFWLINPIFEAGNDVCLSVFMVVRKFSHEQHTGTCLKLPLAAGGGCSCRHGSKRLD